MIAAHSVRKSPFTGTLSVLPWLDIAVEPHISLVTLLLIFLLLCFNSTPTHSPTPYIIIKRNTISDFHIGEFLKDVDSKLKEWRWEDLYCKISAVLIFTSDKSSSNEESIWFWVWCECLHLTAAENSTALEWNLGILPFRNRHRALFEQQQHCHYTGHWDISAVHLLPEENQLL